jgi:phosphate transport system permease protein
MSASIRERIGMSYVFASTLLSTAILLMILLMLLIFSWQAFYKQGWQLFTTVWNPPAGQYGILSMLYGTAAVTVIAVTIAVPLGIFTVIMISEIVPGRYRIAVKSLLELLAGIPSIIYGLIGVAVFSIWIGNIFDLQTGRTILTGGVLLAIMILPIVITLSEDALHNVPAAYREAAFSFGLYRHEVIGSVLFPIAKSDIIGGVLLGLGRAMGETMAVMLVIGSIDRIPDPVFNTLVPGQTITSKLGREIAESAFGSLHFSSMICMGFILLLSVLVITLIAQRSINMNGRLYE